MRRRNSTMKRGAAWAVLLAGLLAATGCAPVVDPVQRYSRYTKLMTVGLQERIVPADPAVIERTYRSNLDYGVKIRPRAARADHPLAGVVREVLFRLPPEVKRLAERHLVALYLLEDDYGTAVTEAVADEQGLWRYGYIGLNLTALSRNANDWATWKENSAFRPAAERELKVQIELQSQDDRAGAVRFILLHELGHVLGLGLNVHPSWEDEKPLPPESYPYLAISWRRGEKNRAVSRWKARFPRLHEASFYAFDKAKFSLLEIEGIYNMLTQTDLPSLYGVINPYDDFAEAFVIYVHTRLLNKPYRVELHRGGRVVRVFRSCIQTGGCPRKTAFLRGMLGAG